MKSKNWFVALVGLVILVADQAAKYAVERWVGLGGSWSLFSDHPDLIAITPGINTGTACGYFPQFGQFFAFAPVIILVIVILFYSQQREPGWLLSLGTGLIIGGALGNLVDRLRFGYVVDYMYIYHWPVFNVADAAVSTAVVLLLLWSLKEETVAQPVTAEGTPVPQPRGASWKLAVSFLALLGVMAVISVFVCVVLPNYLPR